MTNLNKDTIHKENKYNCGVAVPCFGCKKLTKQRVETTLPSPSILLGEEDEPGYGETHFWAPICDNCLKETEKQTPEK